MQVFQRPRHLQVCHIFIVTTNERAFPGNTTITDEETTDKDTQIKKKEYT